MLRVTATAACKQLSSITTRRARSVAPLALAASPRIAAAATWAVWTGLGGAARCSSAAPGNGAATPFSTATTGTPFGTEAAWDLWKAADAVCFDVDSTVISEEGIDVMAAHFGKGEEVAAMTKRAMEGSTPFHVALDMRLKAMQPSKEGVDAFIADSPIHLTPGIADLVAALQASGKTVYLVSGGFREVIDPIADLLSIPRENVFANRIIFNNDGSYQNFDETEPTSQAGGKAEVIKHLKASRGHSVVAMVGDGATDLETKGEGGADVFVGFGGVVERSKVKAHADIFAYDFVALTEAVDSTA